MYDDERDDLDDMIARRAVENPDFPVLVEVAQQQRVIEREAAARHEQLGLASHGVTDPAQGTVGRLLPRAEHTTRSYNTGRSAQGRR